MSSTLLARQQARSRDRAGVDHRIGSAVIAALHGRQRVEWQSRAVHADPLPHLLGPQQVARESEHERLGDAHDREVDLAVAGRVHAAAHADDTDAEELGRDLRERRIDVRRGAAGVAPVALVCLGHELLHAHGRGQAAGGDERRLERRIRDAGRRAHVQKLQITGTSRTETTPKSSRMGRPSFQ